MLEQRNTSRQDTGRSAAEMMLKEENVVFCQAWATVRLILLWKKTEKKNASAVLRKLMTRSL